MTLLYSIQQAGRSSESVRHIFIRMERKTEIVRDKGKEETELWLNKDRGSFYGMNSERIASETSETRMTSIPFSAILLRADSRILLYPSLAASRTRVSI
jgi:hypothetical protein